MDNRTIEQVRKNETKLINEIKDLEHQVKKQKEVIDKVKKLITNSKDYQIIKSMKQEYKFKSILTDLLDILKEVSE